MSIWSRNWWMILTCAFMALIHLHFLKEKKNVLHVLNERLEKMEAEKLETLQAKKELELRIASQSDPAWIEMILIRELGVVPEGFLKVHFEPNQSSKLGRSSGS